MKIVAFIQQQREINKLCDNLGYPKYRAPPPLNAPSTTPSRIIEPLWDHFDQATFYEILLADSASSETLNQNLSGDPQSTAAGTILHSLYPIARSH